MKNKITILTIAFNLIFISVNAQTPVLVKQNIIGMELSSYDGKAYFAENDYINSIYRPWVSDGTAAGTLKLSDSINLAQGFTKVGNFVFFNGTNPSANGRLYKTDGTVAGTSVVKINNTSSTEVNFSSAIELNNKLVFTATDVKGAGAWVTDGTSSGTSRIKSSSSPFGAYVIGYQKTNNKIVYLTNYGTSSEVHSYDGTTDVTLLGLMTYSSNLPTLANVRNPLTLGGYAYYSYEYANPFQLHVAKTDGKTLYDVAFLPVGTKEFVATSNAVYFQMYTSATGAELYKADLNFNNITLVKDVNPGAANDYVSDLMVMNDIVYFAGNDGTNGAELWRSDGTSSGTYMVKDINPGSSPSLQIGGFTHMPSIFVFCNTLYFMADDGTHGPELWTSDGTTIGTNIIKDFNPGSGGSQINELNISNGRMYLFAFNGTSYDLWKIDECFTPASIEHFQGKKNNVILYPNPSSENLFIQSSDKIKSINCTNYLGQMVSIKQENTSIDISSLSRGIYFLNFTLENGSNSIQKFIKE